MALDAGDGMYEVPGNRLRELRDAEEQRDRYRKALAEIVALPRPQFQTGRTWREIALEALRDG